MAKKKTRKKTATGTVASEDLAQHREQLETDPSKMPSPSLQPGTLPDEGARGFSTTEIPWWNNGIWGMAGYAIPNDGGKATTKNSVVHSIHAFIGRELFNIMHKPDVKFHRPPNSVWLHSVAKMIRLGRKRMFDIAVNWNDERLGDADHNTTSVKSFLLFPVPFFGGRIGNHDARMWCEILLVLLGEIMQHSDNDYDSDITSLLASEVDQQLKRIEYTIATKYLEVPRAEAEADDYSLPLVIDNTNYHPDNLFTSAEMMNERPPIDWWPSANDLSPLASGIPAPIAKAYAMRYPIADDDFYGDQHAHERAWPGGSTGPARVPKPGSRRAEKR